jgi:hypothetical protein
VVEPDFKKIVREFFPNTTDEEASDILWSRTAFPFDTSNLHKQLAAAKAHQDAGRVQCLFCDKEAMPNDSVCFGCAKTLRESKDESKNKTKMDLAVCRAAGCSNLVEQKGCTPMCQLVMEECANEIVIKASGETKYRAKTDFGCVPESCPFVVEQVIGGEP